MFRRCEQKPTLSEYNHITLEKFLDLAREHLDVEINDATIESVREQDELPTRSIQDIIAGSEAFDAMSAWNFQYSGIMNAALKASLQAGNYDPDSGIVSRLLNGNGWTNATRTSADLISSVLNTGKWNEAQRENSALITAALNHGAPPKFWTQILRDNPGLTGNILDAGKWADAQRPRRQLTDDTEPNKAGSSPEQDDNE
ncbi:hypothetical protein HQO82_13635 [Rhodococcus fascians]|nr:hypothetical protein [Rhodococcus fascians]MBY4114866.1 hypothetical protein [Rhodococcus fascians]